MYLNKAPDSRATPRSQLAPVHSMVIIYENTATRLRAGRFSGDLIHEIGESLHWTKDFWSHAALDLPESRRGMTEAAAMADVVILALDCRAELGDDFKAWLEDWGSHLYEHSPILIVLFNDSKKQERVLTSNRIFLETIVDACDLTFLYTQGESIVEYRPDKTRA